MKARTLALLMSAALPVATQAQVGAINAAMQPGADMCAKISTAAQSLHALNPQGGIIDATGFAGVQPCAAAFAANWPSGGAYKIELAGVVMLTSVGQAVPSYTLLGGEESYQSFPYNGAYGSIIQAATNFPPNTPVLDLGVGNISFGSKVQYLGITCKPPSGVNPIGCIALRNQRAQEGSGAIFVNLDGGTDADLVIDTPADGSSSPQNSGPYANITTSLTGVTNPTAKCIRIGPSYPFVQVIGSISQVSCGTGSAVQSSVGIAIDGSELLLENIHIEGTRVGIEVAENHSAYSVQVRNIDCSGGGLQMTSCLHIANNNWNAYPFIAEGVFANAGVTNVIADDQPNGLLLPASIQGTLTRYARTINSVVKELP